MVTCLIVLFLAFSDEVSVGNRFSFVTQAERHANSNCGNRMEEGLNQGGKMQEAPETARDAARPKVT